MDKDLSFITINYNGQEDTTALISSLQRCMHTVDWEIIVVDNCSRTDEASTLNERFAKETRVRIIRSYNNIGFAGGNNFGLRHAHGRNFMFINNDTFIEEDHFDELIKRLESDSNIGAVCPKIRFAQGKRPIQFAGFTDLSRITLRNSGIGCGEQDNGQYDQPTQTAFAHGAALLFNINTLERAGMMSEAYFLYYEEMDWSMRMSEADLQIWYDPAQTVFHLESQSTGQESPLRTFYMCRNRLLFARRNRTIPTRWLSYAYLAAVLLCRDIPQHLVHRRKDLAAASIRGLWAFIKMRRKDIEL